MHFPLFCNPKIQSREVSLHEHVLGSSNCDHGGDGSLLLNGNHSHQNNCNNCTNGFSSQSSNHNHSSSNSHQLPSLFIDSVLEPQAGAPFSLLTEHHHHHHHQQMTNNGHGQQMNHHQMNGHETNGMNGYGSNNNNAHVRLPPFCSIWNIFIPSPIHIFYFWYTCDTQSNYYLHCWNNPLLYLLHHQGSLSQTN